MIGRENRDQSSLIEEMNRTEIALTEVRKERNRQRLLLSRGEISFAVEDVKTPDAYKLAVLMEEVGEVATAIHEDEPYEDLRKELIQVAAVAVAWAEALGYGGKDAPNVPRRILGFDLDGEG